jgi:hypothetical protein
MACDGHIDDAEVALIKKLHHEEALFGELDVDASIRAMISGINAQGNIFLSSYLDVLESSDLTEDEQVMLFRTAVRTVEADERIEYREVKFVKIIRSKLTVDDSTIESGLEATKNLDLFLEKDMIVSKGPVSIDFFDTSSMPSFEVIDGFGNASKP